ncbi:MAG: Maf family nucleotide pyrophosphatase [Hyphomicrobiales bacterium]|nr:Maf family nucleotide pyrophosphatase [Hyphomicrobiales bacterium]MCY4037991.1 Maf family nucleotide pyrophosphatase [Hyphomicrobiales bacterium]
MFILASESQQRLELLQQLNLRPDEVVGANIDEAPLKAETPRQAAARLARAKAETVSNARAGAIVLAADTVVAKGRRILPKPAGRDHAREILKILSGSTHRVHTAVCVLRDGNAIGAKMSVTRVFFKRLHPDEIEAYLDTNEWNNRAGAYAIQKTGERFVRKLDGSFSGASGLPIRETLALLRAAGIEAARRRAA